LIFCRAERRVIVSDMIRAARRIGRSHQSGFVAACRWSRGRYAWSLHDKGTRGGAGSPMLSQQTAGFIAAVRRRLPVYAAR